MAEDEVARNDALIDRALVRGLDGPGVAEAARPRYRFGLRGGPRE